MKQAVHAGIDGVEGAHIGAGAGVAGGAGGLTIAAGLHVPEERFAEPLHRRFVDVVDVRRLRHRHRRQRRQSPATTAAAAAAAAAAAVAAAARGFDDRTECLGVTSAVQLDCSDRSNAYRRSPAAPCPLDPLRVPHVCAP